MNESVERGLRGAIPGIHLGPAILERERQTLEEQRLAANAFRERADARVKSTYERLKARYDGLQAKQGLAYRQLKQCATYAARIKDQLRIDFNPCEIHSTNLEGAMEWLKALSGKGFDDA